MKLPPREHRLEHISGIHRSVGLPGAHDGMQLIDKQKDLSVTVLDILEHCLQPLLKFAPVLCAGDQRPHIQRKDPLVLQPLRHIAAHDTLRQPLDDRSLAHAGLPDEHRIVLRLSRQDADDIADLVIPPDDRVKLLVLCLLHEILSIFFKRVICRLGVVARHALIAPHLRQSLQETFSCDPVLAKDLLDLPVGILDHGQKEMLHRDILISHALCLILSADQHLVEILSHIRLPALYLDALLQCLLHPVKEIVPVDLHPLNQLQDQAVLYRQECVEQMLLLDLLVSVFHRKLLALVDCLDRLLCKFLYVHNAPPLMTHYGSHKSVCFICSILTITLFSVLSI